MLDVISRYKSVLRNVGDEEKILEVGNGGSGIARFLTRRVVGIDVYAEKPTVSNLTQVSASGSALPIKNDSFDIVVSASVLEHISSEKRAIFIEEMLRVGRKKVVINVPCGKKSAEYEKSFNNLVRKITGHDHEWIVEHLKYKLPEIVEIEKTVKDAYPNAKINVQKNFNLRLWYFYKIFYLGIYKIKLILKLKDNDKYLKWMMKYFGWLLPILDFGITHQQTFVILKQNCFFERP